MLVKQPDWETRSPWSSHNDKQMVKINPPKAAVNGVIRVPGSKSLTNRALIMAALAEGKSDIQGILRSDDSYWCIEALTKLGVQVVIEGETAYIEGCGGVWPNRNAELYVGAAGTVARFLPGALAIAIGEWSLKGGSRLSERPLAPLLGALTQLGARFEYKKTDRCLPFTLHANGLQGGEVIMPGSTSSQFISGLLLAAPYAKDRIIIHIDGEIVQKDYVQMTLDMMASFGITPEEALDGQAIVVPTGKYQAQSLQLEPDVSTCCYFWALAALTAGTIRIEGINATITSQPDIEILDILEQMGCTVIRGEDNVEVQGVRQLKGGFTISMKKWSDQTLTIAAMAPFADGPITLKDAAHIRHHECDRIAAICEELSKLGIRVDEHQDGLTIYPGQPVAAVLDSHDDHRMAMALSLIGVRVPDIRISDPGCVSKTCPDFFEQMSLLGVDIAYEQGGIEQDGR
ncbi:3-phosphoshikimate 1-carboxyvinyltransferase [Paenibacillus pectinilyticus]|uniref:3-phosphoshikimate 1-carboxyvinyltransferase n=1 Tax=Paenibacillus pectinilyticus TaxID=512399 RepID=A0A1C1A0M1_9BACL|nr:3-phosphoshikimate 1-carboxyvinyltransferase [Paenibacillus pectinilyticus]OCT13969.1 3-phosphoshikimate 1-carboxyvinyltransferase [Paenibacillus pectinilyticus]